MNCFVFVVLVLIAVGIPPVIATQGNDPVSADNSDGTGVITSINQSEGKQDQKVIVDGKGGGGRYCSWLSTTYDDLLLVRNYKKGGVAWSYTRPFRSWDAISYPWPFEWHDRFTITLAANTGCDKGAYWHIVSHQGLTILDEIKIESEERTAQTWPGGRTVQAWLVEADEEGSHILTAEYVGITPNSPDPQPILDLTYNFAVLPSAWKIQTIDKTGGGSGAGAFPDLVTDEYGRDHISYYNAEEGQIKYAEGKEGTLGSAWVLHTIAPSAGTYSTSIALDDSHQAAISFGNRFISGNLMFAKWQGKSAITEKVDGGSAGDAGQYSSLAFDNTGKPRITYNDGQHYATLMETRFDGKSWTPFKVDTGGLTGDTGYSSSIVIDKNGHSHIAYTNGKSFANLMYATDASGSWVITTVDNGGSVIASTGFDPSIALDSRGFPHIAYYDASAQDLRYASWNGTGWDTETVESLNDIGKHPSLAIDSRDQPHISYYDASYKELRYVVYNTTESRYLSPLGDWHAITVDNTGDVGDYSSIALDGNDHPRIAYYDATNHALKYAGWTG